MTILVMDVFKWLNDHTLVSSYIVNDFKKSDAAFYLNLKAVFIDDSELHVREYVDIDHRKYAFHWQSSNGELILRWDNAPHFRNIVTFPHHKHLALCEITESHDISFDEVLSFIQLKLNT